MKEIKLSFYIFMFSCFHNIEGLMMFSQCRKLLKVLSHVLRARSLCNIIF